MALNRWLLSRECVQQPETSHFALGKPALRGHRGERRRPQSGEMRTWLFFVSGEDFAEAAHSVHES